jgi:hypothetical protein
MRITRAAALLAPTLTLVLAVGSGGTRCLAAGADGKFDERSSSHFRLLQDVAIDGYSGRRGSRAFERGVLEVLESAYRQLGDAIGIRPRSRITVILYDDAVFEQAFGRRFGFRAAGFFDGSIHVRSGTVVDRNVLRTLHHEYTHAALHQAAADLFPAWLNEGLAEYFEARAAGKRHLSAPEDSALRGAAREGSWISLQHLGTRSFSHLGGKSASLAYLESYAVVEHLVRRHGMRKLRDFCRQLVKTRSVSRALDRTYRTSLSKLEGALLAELS